MIFLDESSGQLGNRLLISSHIISYALSKNEIIVDLSFYKYKALFRNHKSFLKSNVIIIKSKIVVRIIKFILIKTNHLLKETFNLNFLDFYQVGWIHTEIENLHRNKKRWLFLDGEGFRDKKALQIKGDIIRNIFLPKEKYLGIVDSIIEDLKKHNTLLVGVHIRRGDYKVWMNGKYYFSNEVYLKAIEQFRDLYLTNTKIKFLICSDENIDSSDFDRDDIYIRKNMMIIDLYLFSRCDFLIGPLSTFSGWASFYGNVPIYTIENSEFLMKKDDFAIFEL